MLSDSTKSIKMTAELINLIEEKLCLDWDPEQVSGWLITEGKVLPVMNAFTSLCGNIRCKMVSCTIIYAVRVRKCDNGLNGKSTRG